MAWDHLVAPKSSFFEGRILIFLLKNLRLYIKLTASDQSSTPSVGRGFIPCAYVVYSSSDSSAGP